MFLKIIIILSILFTTFSHAEKIKYKKGLRVDMAEACPDHPPDAFMNLQNLQLTTTSDGTRLFYEVNVTQDLEKKFETLATLKRCKSRENLNSCENWSPLRTKNICPIVHAKGQIWSSIVASIRPPFECPIKKGFYIANGTFDVNGAMYLPFEGHYWLSSVKVLTQKTRVRFSYCGHFEVDRFRV